MDSKDHILGCLLVQYDIAWEQKELNFKRLAQLIQTESRQLDLIVLPEMFATGFTNNTTEHAEQEKGMTLEWMHKIAMQRNCIVLGGIIAQHEDKYYNRMLVVGPEGLKKVYDKHHLFTYSNEPDFYTAGNTIVHLDIGAWNLNLSICYDLRFPLWLRNTSEYDVLVNIANWPISRVQQWSNLLVGRAIENQAYVLGVNRVGIDGNNLKYNGQSCAVNFDGTYLEQLKEQESAAYVELNLDELHAYRRRFPFLADQDKFSLE